MTELAPSFSRERLVAELVVQRTSVIVKNILKQVQAHQDDQLVKDDATPVTVADFAGQALMISALRHSFPTDRFMGEENADVLRRDEALKERVWEVVSSVQVEDAGEEELARPRSIGEMLEMIDLGGQEAGGSNGRIWMLDPVDGTATFLRGEQFAVSLALVEDGREVVGVLGCPNIPPNMVSISESSVDNDGYGVMISSVRGHGAHIRTMNSASLLQPARKLERFVAPGSEAPPALKFVDSSLSGSYRSDLARKVALSFGARTYPDVDIWSSHVRYAALILGHGDVQVRIPREELGKTPCAWDHAGAQLIFKEVGGEITDLRGKEIDFGAGRHLGNNFGAIVAKDWIHGMILKGVGDVMRDEKK